MAQKNLKIIHLANVPEELLSNILIRLPSKFVVRCKLVCKQWASLISDPFFVSSYISRFPSSPSSWTVVGERVTDRCIGYDLPKHMCCIQDFRTLCLSIDHERKAHQSFKVFGANDGMILFGLIEYHTMAGSYKSCNLYYVCNPAIRKLISLSPPSPNFQTVDWYWGSGLVTRVENDVLESFRVVLLTPDRKSKRLRFRVYASETQEWNEHYIVPGRRHRVSEKLPTAFNRILHWVTEDGFIIAYDPYADPPGRVRVIAPPDDADAPRKGGFVRFMCDASRGKLSYFERLATAASELGVRFKMWVLEDYYGSGTWRLSHESDESSVRHDSAVVSRWSLVRSLPMFLDPFDPDIVYLRLFWIGVVSYDVKTGKVEVALDVYYTNRLVKNAMFPWYLSCSVELLP